MAFFTIKYTCGVWSPYLLKDVKKAEASTKVWTGILTIATELLSLFHIPSIQDRRLYLSLCTMYKIINDHVVFFLQSNLNSSRSTLVFTQPLSRINSMKFYYVPFISSVWNTLMNHVVHMLSHSATTFKKINVAQIHLCMHFLQFFPCSQHSHVD